MTSSSSSSRTEVMETAAQWFARMDSGEGNQAEFDAWRDADPSHAAAFAQIYASMRQMEKLRGLTAPVEVRAQPTRRSFLATGSIAAGLIGVLAIGAVTWNMSAGRVYAATGVGERKTMPFPGGGQIELNTDTKAAWRMTGEQREIWLDRGEVAIKVAAGSKPIRLKAGDHVTQLGSGEYIARLRDKSLDLISLAGTAIIDPDTAKPLRVTPSQAAIVSQEVGRIRPMSTDDVNFLTGWRNDELVLNGQVLSEVVEEYNRYLDKKIIIANPELGAIQLGGRFTNRDPSKLFAGLETSFGIHVTQENNSVILSR